MESSDIFVRVNQNGNFLVETINSEEFKFQIVDPVDKFSLLTEIEKIRDPKDELFIVCESKSKYQDSHNIQTVFNISDSDIRESNLNFIRFGTFFLLYGKIIDILSVKLPSNISVLIPIKILIKNLKNLIVEICHSKPKYEIRITEKIKSALQHMQRHGWNVLITSQCGVTVTFGDDVLCTVQLKFTPKYPGIPVEIVMTRPFTYVFPTFHVDSQPNLSLMEDIMVLTTDLFNRRAEMASRLPIITGDAYLVLGATPYEERRGRTHYQNQNVFFLDNQPIRHERFIQVDFSSPVEMGILSSLLPNTFNEICFDDSTFKFFSGDGDYNAWNTHTYTRQILKNLPGSMLYERICYLTHMLKDTGTMFIERVGNPSGAVVEEEFEFATPDDLFSMNREKVVDYCRRAGLDVNFNKVREIGRSSFLVPLLYKTVSLWDQPNDGHVLIGDGSEFELLVARKISTLR